MIRDPHRWLEDPAANPRLTELLESSGAPLDLPAAVNARVGEALQQLASTAARAGVAATAKPSLLANLVAKPVIVGSIALAAAGGGLAGYRLMARQSSVAESPGVVAEVRSPAVEQPAATPVEPPAATVSDLPLESDRAVVARPRAQAIATASSSTLAEEARLLESVRAAIATDPSAARRILTQYDARFPRGALKQERALLAVRLAVAEGRRGEAKAQATELENAAKDSPYAKKAREVVDSSEHTDGARTITE